MRARKRIPRGILAVRCDEAEPRALPPAGQELRHLHSEESTTDLYNSIADFCVYFLISEPKITQELGAKVARSAVERFRGRLPDGMIRILVAATIQQELGLREQAARTKRAAVLRKQLADEARRRRGSPPAG